MDKLRQRIYSLVLDGGGNIKTGSAIMDLIKPKELVWGEDEGGTLVSGSYRIYNHVKYFLSFGGTLLSNDGYKSEREAKAAAQAHYNRMFYEMMGVPK